MRCLVVARLLELQLEGDRLVVPLVALYLAYVRVYDQPIHFMSISLGLPLLCNQCFMLG